MRNHKVQLAVGIVLSAVFLYLALRPVNPADLWAAIKAFNWWWAAPYVAVQFFSFYLRAVRWRYLLEPMGSFTGTRLFSPMMAGFAINSLLPARLGEFARAFILGRREKVSVSAAFATVVVERIFDSVVLLAMLPLALASIKIDPNFRIERFGFVVTGEGIMDGTTKLAIVVAVMAGGVIALLLPPAQRLFLWFVHRLPLPHSLRDFIDHAFQTFVTGLKCLRSARAWAAVVFLSFATWIVIGWSAVILSYGFEGMKMSLVDGIIITIITCIAIAVPAAPGYWGLMQVGMVAGMFLTGVEKDYARALGWSFIGHSLQYFPIVAVGLFCLWREHVSISEVSHAQVEE